MLEVLKPWDGDVDVEGKPRFKAICHSGAELVDKSIECFYKVRRSDFGEYLQIMKAMGLPGFGFSNWKSSGWIQLPFV
jgi:hypothetical protein